MSKIEEPSDICEWILWGLLLLLLLLLLVCIIELSLGWERLEGIVLLAPHRSRIGHERIRSIGTLNWTEWVLPHLLLLLHHHVRIELLLLHLGGHHLLLLHHHHLLLLLFVTHRIWNKANTVEHIKDLFKDLLTLVFVAVRRHLGLVVLHLVVNWRLDWTDQKDH